MSAARIAASLRCSRARWNFPALPQRIARGLDRHVRFGVRCVGFVMSAVCPVYPNEQTSSGSGGRSQKCQQRTLSLAPSVTSSGRH
jgi:hypothetical protein